MSLADAIARITRLDGVAVTVGMQGTPAAGDSSMTELVAIAAAHEFGLGVPMRPFLRTSLKLKGPRWARGMRAMVRRYRAGDYAGAEQTIRRVAVVAVGDVQATIRDHDWTPNSPATIAAKGSDKPLIDSGQMRQSVRAAVEIPGRDAEVVA